MSFTFQFKKFASIALAILVAISQLPTSYAMPRVAAPGSQCPNDFAKIPAKSVSSELKGYKEGLYGSVSDRAEIDVAGLGTLKFEDSIATGNLISVVRIPGATFPGRVEMSLRGRDLTLPDIVTPLEGSPTWVKPSGQILLDEQKGVPMAAYIGMHAMKKLGIGSGSLRSWKVETIRHLDTIVPMAKKILDWKKINKKDRIPADIVLKFYLESPMHRLNLNMIEQSGHKISGIHLNPDERYGKVVDGKTELHSWFSKDADKTVNSVNRLQSASPRMATARWKPGILDKEALNSHLEKLLQQNGIEEGESLPMDFSVFYDLEPRN